jgi:hypothetical protein
LRGELPAEFLMVIVAALGSGLDMWKRLFPSLAEMDGGKLMGWAITAVFLWVSIAGALEGYFISQGWITVTYEQAH